MNRKLSAHGQLSSRGLALSVAAAALSFALAGATTATGQVPLERGAKSVPPTLTSNQRAAIQAKMTRLQRLRPVRLDLSKKGDRDFFVAIKRLAGVTEANNPEFRHFLKYATAFHTRRGAPRDGQVFLTAKGRIDSTGAATTDAVGPIAVISSLESKPGNPQVFGASALVSLPQQPQTCTQTLQVLDEQGNPQGQADSVTQVLACENVQLFAEAQLDPSDQWAQATLTTHWIDQSGNPFILTVAAAGSAIPIEIVSDDPNDKTGDHMIKFCFGRQGADCDYQPATLPSTVVALPINGNTTYAGPLVTPASDPAASVSITITNPKPQSGGGCSLVGNVAQFMQSYVSLSNNNQTVTWTAPAINFPAIDPCMPTGSIVYYNMMMNLDLQFPGQPVQPTFFGISSSPSTPVSTGFFKQLEETRIYYSCLAAGTMVAMADGSRKAIEHVRAGDEVRDGKGAVRRVASTFAGEEERIVRIVTADGQVLRATEGHPLMTAAGPRLAKFVKTGDRVLTSRGPMSVTEAVTGRYEGKVFNLRLERGVTRAGLSDDEDATFFGDGFLVGDNEAQWRYDRAGATETAAAAPSIRPAMSSVGKAMLERRLGRAVDAAVY